MQQKGADMMPEMWTGDLIGRMHNAKVTKVDIANELGVHKSYISMILNGQRKPRNAEAKLNAAFDAIMARRNEGGK
jgi:hypothetical protein